MIGRNAYFTLLVLAAAACSNASPSASSGDGTGPAGQADDTPRDSAADAGAPPLEDAGALRAPSDAAIASDATTAAEGDAGAGADGDASDAALDGPAPVASTTCSAGDPVTLAACMATIDTWSTLQITGTITYTDDAPIIDLTGQSNKTIQGTTSSAGLANNGTGSQPWINVNQSSNITITGLQLNGPFQFDDTTYYQDYQSAIYIIQSQSVTLDSLTVQGTYGPGIRAIATSQFTLTSSEINNTGEYGLQMGYGSGTAATFVNVQNDYIHNARVNGIIAFLQGGGGITDNLIANNVFDNNHHHGLYDQCDGICPGGQIDLLAGATDITITSNTIMNGDCDNCAGTISGIELNAEANIQITANHITGNTGTSAYVNPGQTLSGCTITDNALWYNGSNHPDIASCNVFGNDECSSNCGN